MLRRCGAMVGMGPNILSMVRGVRSFPKLRLSMFIVNEDV